MASDDQTVVPLHGPATLASEGSQKISPSVDSYTYWVLQKLTGLRGRDPTDVSYYILRDWIQRNRAELEELGISATVADGHAVIRSTAENE